MLEHTRSLFCGQTVVLPLIWCLLVAKCKSQIAPEQARKDLKKKTAAKLMDTISEHFHLPVFNIVLSLLSTCLTDKCPFTFT